jgi:uncharacterized protein DUF1592/uncharacterized protein DUF1588/uncharacterized protein DUF1595/uncharacterized protein DUF1587/uncharacterized protein DUF1585
MHPLERTLCACLVVLATGPACYTGLSGGPGQHDAAEAGDAGQADDAGESGGSDDDGAAGSACDTLELGATPLMRLTRTEYDNTIVDLLGIDGHPGSALPPDGVSGLFANNGESGPSNYAVEVYRDLAETLAAQADVFARLPCDPAVIGERECAQAFIEQLGRRAFRRDLEPAQRDRLLAVYDLGREGESFEAGLRMVLEAILQSPMFLYRVESGIPEDGGEVVALDDFELASRLSYFLWRSMPDDELLDAAAAGMLADRDAVELQARRMLEDPRAERALLTFYGDLFALDTLGSTYKDPELFPEYSAELAADMRTELELFVLSSLRDGDARLETLLGDSHSFVNARLAAHYGIEAPAGDGFVRVELDPSRYRGLLTKPALLSITAHDQRTSPTLRGKLVRTRLFCQTLPPPPPGVESTIPTVDMSTREWVQQRLDNPSCAGCHERMDPIGLAFEQFDAVGRHRTDEDGVAIDSSGSLFETDVDGEIVGVAELADKLLASEEVGACVSRQWFEFALGRVPASEDTCTNDALLEEFESSDHDIVELMVAIATSPTFRSRRPDALEDSP